MRRSKIFFFRSLKKRKRDVTPLTLHILMPK
jgi:hypothetical protein